MSTLVSRVMENTLAYRVWQAPFAGRKLAPILRCGDIGRARRVLDVGCGPGTNTPRFAHADYVGIDVNAAYIESARRRHARQFVVADVTRYEVPAGERFDFILVNSLLHHLRSDDVLNLLRHLATLLSEDGHVHILDLVLPSQPSLARLLALWDRGDYPRPLGEWRALFGDAFDAILFEPYPLGALWTTLWSMVYFKGRARA